MKLQSLLTEYLIEHGNLPLAGTGRLYIKHTGATITGDTITNPVNTITFSTAKPSETEQQKLINFITAKYNVSVAQAEGLWKSESDFETVFTDKTAFEWTALGTFQKNDNGTVSFTQNEGISKYLPAISLAALKKQPLPEAPVVKVIEEETVQEETVAALEYQYIETEQKDRWWIWAIVIFVLSVILILFKYFVMD